MRPSTAAPSTAALRASAQDDSASAQDDSASAQDDSASAQDDTGVLKSPAPDELAAVAAALAIYARRAARATNANRTSAWTLAMRRPELEFDELRALRNSCSTRS